MSFRKIINKIGIQVNRYREFDSDISNNEQIIIKQVRSYTMTSNERIVSVIRAIDYLEKFQIEGDIVECGVWRGGSTMAAALELINLGNSDRKFYLYDTFEGMSKPSEKDIMYTGESAEELLNKTPISDPDSIWCKASLQDVKRNFSTIDYPQKLIKFVKGKVEKTIPSQISDKIALLRLDTDWHESTKHELIHLYPRLVEKGILIIDDYGHWSGCKKAVDEYFNQNNIPIFLSRIDYTGRIGVKIK